MTCATKITNPRYDCKQRCIRYTECFSKHVNVEAQPIKKFEFPQEV